VKKLILIFLIIACASLKAQTFSVGDINCNYKLVNYSFNVPCNWHTNASDSYSIDIDSDLISDLSIQSSCNWYYNSSIGGYFSVKEIDIYPGFNCQVVTGMTGIIQLSYGTPLNNALNWNTYSGPLLGLMSNPCYIGFRKIISGDTLYSWINIDYSALPGGINSYDFKRTSDISTTQPTTITSLPASICKGDSLSLTANPSGGNFYGNGVSNNYFKSKNLAAGVYTVMYTVPNATACSTIPSVSNITVNPLPTITFTGTPYNKCVSDTITIGALPAGGTFSYSASGFSGNMIYCAQSGIGTHTLTYTYTDGNGCTKTQPAYVIVASCVGINELSQEQNNLQIFPNPNSGEFEIKGPKKTNVIITNELGQVVKTIELNSSNNYSSKITELQSGVYFIGNKLSRQKIVVIK
jgi:hypothetical protein